MNPKALLHRLRILQRSLEQTYPYAFKIGKWLRAERPQWAAEFAIREEEKALLPLAQARDFAFLAFAEKHHLKELDDLLVRRFFPSAPAYLRVELANTVRWYGHLAEIKEH